jgi:hypothetical protein
VIVQNDPDQQLDESQDEFAVFGGRNELSRGYPAEGDQLRTQWWRCLHRDPPARIVTMNRFTRRGEEIAQSYQRVDGDYGEPFENSRGSNIQAGSTQTVYLGDGRRNAHPADRACGRTRANDSP